MRLNKRNKGSFVGPASCAAAVGLVIAGVICPQVYSTHATEVVPPTQVQFSVNRAMMDGVEAVPREAALEFEVDRTMIDGQEEGKDVDVQFHVVGFGRETEEVDVEFEILEYLQLTKEAGFTLEMPEVADGTSSVTSNFSVAGNNANGFGVYVYAPDATSLVAEDANNDDVIATTATNVTLSNLADNTWGYNLKSGMGDDELLKTVQSEPSAPAKSISQPGKMDLEITCGAKVNGVAADTYSTKLVLAAVAPYTAALVAE